MLEHPPTSEHMESPEPTFSLEAILLNLFLKHGLEQKRLIFQFPINSGKRPSICQKLLIKRQLSSSAALFLSPKYY